MRHRGPGILLVTSPGGPANGNLAPTRLSTLLTRLPMAAVILISRTCTSFMSASASCVGVLISGCPGLVVSHALSGFCKLPKLHVKFKFVDGRLTGFNGCDGGCLNCGHVSRSVTVTTLGSSTRCQGVTQLVGRDHTYFRTRVKALPNFGMCRSITGFILVGCPVILGRHLRGTFTSRSCGIGFVGRPSVGARLHVALKHPRRGHVIVSAVGGVTLR